MKKRPLPSAMWILGFILNLVVKSMSIYFVGLVIAVLTVQIYYTLTGANQGRPLFDSDFTHWLLNRVLIVLCWSMVWFRRNDACTIREWRKRQVE